MKTLTIRFDAIEPIRLNGALRRAMRARGLRRDETFAGLDIDEELVDVLVNQAVAHLGAPHGARWSEAVLNDGSKIQDTGPVLFAVHSVDVNHGGLMGDEYVYDLTVAIPPAARWMPPRRNPTIRRATAKPARVRRARAARPKPARRSRAK